MQLIKVIVLIVIASCLGCATKTALQQKCSEGDAAACDQVTRAQQDAEGRPDLSHIPVIAPKVVGP